MRAFKAFFLAEDGATAIEFGLFSALISLVALTGLTALDDGIAPVFDMSSDTVKSVLPAEDA
jgi:Flp pilus assembly pilin Flp